MTTTTPPNPPCKRGDVVLVLFPHSDLQTAKTRPAVVVQADNLDTGVAQVIVAMVSSRMVRAGA
jgi:mRNA interferase MazF